MKKAILFLLFFFLLASVINAKDVFINLENIATSNLSNSGNFTYDIFSSNNITWELPPRNLLNYYNFSIPYLNGISTYQDKYTGELQAINKTTKILNTLYIGKNINVSKGLYLYSRNPASNSNAVGFDFLLNDTYFTDGIHLEFCRFYNSVDTTYFWEFGTGLDDTALNDSVSSGFTVVAGQGGHIDKKLPLKSELNRMILFYYVNNIQVSENEFTICNITLYNATPTNNQLPIANLTIQNYSVCLNNDSITLPINLSVSDRENDTILYATEVNSYQTKSIEVNFYQKICLLPLLPCIIAPDFSKYDELKTGCHIATGDYNNTNYNVIPRQDRFNNSIWMLELNPNCNPNVFYNDVNAITGFTGKFDLWDVQSLNISLNTNDFDDITHQFLNLRLHHNGSNIDLYKNTTDIIATVSYTAFTQLSLTPYLDHYFIELSSLNNKITVNLSATPFNNIVTFIGFTGNATIQRFFYSGTKINPVFTTQKPSELVISQEGYNYLTVFITDNFHIGNYTQYTIPIYVYDSELCNYAQSGAGIGKTANPNLNVDVLGSIKSWFGVSFKYYLVTMGYYEIGEKLLWFIFVILFLVLLVMSGFLFGHFDIMFPLLIDSLAVGFIAFMVEYSTILISMLIILAFALAIPITKALGSGNRGGGEQ